MKIWWRMKLIVSVRAIPGVTAKVKIKKLQSRGPLNRKKQSSCWILIVRNDKIDKEEQGQRASKFEMKCQTAILYG